MKKSKKKAKWGHAPMSASSGDDSIQCDVVDWYLSLAVNTHAFMLWFFVHSQVSIFYPMTNR